jgi:phage anti-repressor protein
MSDHSISADLVFSLCQSQSQFPIDFEDAWEWIGYSRKDSAKRALLSFGFMEGIDLHIEVESMEGKFGTPEEYITMSVDCLKMWAMMAATEKGRETRIYFLQCERKLKQLISPAKPKSLLDLTLTQLYQLATYQRLIEIGKQPNLELVEGIDLEYLSATSEAVNYAYHRVSCDIAIGTKLANDALREFGLMDDSDKARRTENKDIAEFAKHRKWLDDRFPGKQGFDRFESRQLSLAGGSNRDND